MGATASTYGVAMFGGASASWQSVFGIPLDIGDIKMGRIRRRWA
jgi:hypothetical protein